MIKVEIPFGLEWIDEEDTLLVCDSEQIKPSSKVAAFDMDSTLIVPKSGNKFPSGRSDWEWWDNKVPEKLKKLREEGFKIVIFTNQAGIEKNKQNPEHLKGKILDMCSELGFGVQVFMACATDKHRKPNSTMWEKMESKYNGGISLDVPECIYVGDAAGRKKDWKVGAKKDHSADDRKFAFNVGVDFKTPEEFFLAEKPTDSWEWKGVDPKTLLEKYEKEGEKRK